MKKIPIIIPAYEPDERMVALVETLVKADNYIVVVDDGSGDGYSHIFELVKQLLKDKGVVLVHNENMGKGKALKTAFRYILDNATDYIGAVTADCDGQHDILSIDKVAEALIENQDSLVLGIRRFERKSIPWKSYFGNVITLKVFHLISGIKVSDTQTGLRGISISFMRELIYIEENRFEFEMKMLLMTKHKYPIKEVEITTIYDSKTNHQSHFNPWRDSVKIYKTLFRQLLKVKKNNRK